LESRKIKQRGASAEHHFAADHLPLILEQNLGGAQREHAGSRPPGDGEYAVGRARRQDQRVVADRCDARRPVGIELALVYTPSQGPGPVVRGLAQALGARVKALELGIFRTQQARHIEIKVRRGRSEGLAAGARRFIDDDWLNAVGDKGVGRRKSGGPGADDRDSSHGTA